MIYNKDNYNGCQNIEFGASKPTKYGGNFVPLFGKGGPDRQYIFKFGAPCPTDYGISEPLDKEGFGGSDGKSSDKKSKMKTLEYNDNKKNLSMVPKDAETLACLADHDNFFIQEAVKSFKEWFGVKKSEAELRATYQPLCRASDKNPTKMVRTECQIAPSKEAWKKPMTVYVHQKDANGEFVVPGSYTDVVRNCEVLPCVQMMSVWYMSSTKLWGVKCKTTMVVVYPQAAQDMSQVLGLTVRAPVAAGPAAAPAVAAPAVTPAAATPVATPAPAAAEGAAPATPPAAAAAMPAPVAQAAPAPISVAS